MVVSVRCRLALAGLGLSLALPLALQPARAATFTLEGSTVPDIQKAINQGLLTSKKLVQMYLDRIAAYDGSPGLNLNAIISLNPNALVQAAALDAERLVSGARSALHGIPAVEGQHRHLLQEGVQLQASAQAGDGLRKADEELPAKLRMVEPQEEDSVEVSQEGPGEINELDRFYTR